MVETILPAPMTMRTVQPLPYVPTRTVHAGCGTVDDLSIDEPSGLTSREQTGPSSGRKSTPSRDPIVELAGLTCERNVESQIVHTFDIALSRPNELNMHSSLLVNHQLIIHRVKL